ncbi:hypothetical protein [Amycolatopsis sp. CA-230715]|uniref:hypothetical protein n=1 Tax=Amycolatopsis sp. CA-230715 TaxID=2745196 RepID=UPI001C0396C8|nr:hypothetical protein [Amycolatopsis sp. CA-230715]QWF77729.1 hypothetical protein HUW46_01121 [Amycolatopsis sp. CA-230715]
MRAHEQKSASGPRAGTPRRDPVPASLDAALIAANGGRPAPHQVLTAQQVVGNSVVGQSMTGTAPVVQRAVDASLPQPGAAERSAAVPDLPAALVQQLQAARAASEREAALRAMTDYVWNQIGDQDAELRARVRLRYVNRATGPGGAMALTHEQLGGAEDDSPPIVLSIYRGAFERGPAVLYSTLRHELIHAMQRSMVPDEGEASATDEFMFENLYPPPELGPETRDTLQLPMQEIETHVWELVHAGETGVDQTYRTETVDWLVRYTDDLVTGIGGTTAGQFGYWRNYLSRARRLLGDAAAALGTEAAAPVTAAAGRLAAAIATRAAAAANSADDEGRRSRSPGEQPSSKRTKR